MVCSESFKLSLSGKPHRFSIFQKFLHFTIVLLWFRWVSLRKFGTYVFQLCSAQDELPSMRLLLEPADHMHGRLMSAFSNFAFFFCQWLPWLALMARMPRMPRTYGSNASHASHLWLACLTCLALMARMPRMPRTYGSHASHGSLARAVSSLLSGGTMYFVV